MTDIIKGVKKQRGGKRAKKCKNSPVEKKDDLVLKESGETYAVVEKVLGSGRYYVWCDNGERLLAHKRGTLKKKKISVGDILLISLRDFQKEKCDILLRYSEKNIAILRNQNLLEFVNTAVIDETTTEKEQIVARNESRVKQLESELVDAFDWNSI